MDSKSFKQSVRGKLMSCAAIYKSVFIDYEYLIYSDGFTMNPFYIIDAHEDNFAHLTGVKSLLSVGDFYTACISGSLNENDFSFADRNHSEKSVKGTVRRKLQAFHEVVNFFCSQPEGRGIFYKGHGKLHSWHN